MTREDQASGSGTNHSGGFWIRGVALLIDVIVIAILTFPIGLVFPPVFDFEAWTLDVSPIGPLLDFVVIFGYLAGMEGLRGATVGKMALRLKIVDGQGQPIGLGVAIGRNAAKVLSILTLSVGFAIAGFDANKQALHDKLARTFVVRIV